MIKRIWILINGQPIIQKNYVPEGDLVLENFGVIAKSLADEAVPGQLKEEMRGETKLTYAIEASAFFIIASDTQEAGVLEIFLPELIELFFAVFGKEFVENWDGGDISVFKGFGAKIDQLRSSFANRIMTKAGTRRTLDTFSVMELPQRLQNIAYIILDAKTISFKEILAQTNISPEQAVKNIQEILNAGFLYTTKMGNRVFYSVEALSPTIEEARVVTAGSPEKSAVEAPPVTSEELQAVSDTTQPAGLKTEKRDINKGNMPFLIRQIKRDLDRVFDTIINRKALILIINPESDKQNVLLNMMLDTLQCFAPERELKIIDYTEEFIHPQDADIIRINRSLQDYYSNETILDMDNKRVINGISSPYLADLIKTMSNMKHSECVSLLINRIALIEKLAQDWAKIKKLNLPQEDFLVNVRSKHGSEMAAIMDRVAENVYMD
ncbi:MAG: hypothetical protein GF308_11820 [Candidatus Heimdallarchaeota archaeon]|nr:hypothetical protein [Candidatus Heimdallarchaeota archaeon]